MANKKQQLDEISRYFELLKTASSKMSGSGSGSELRDCWEDFLGHFGRCIGRLIRFGLAHTASKPWAHRLKNASQEHDEGLCFLREARNQIEHGMTPFADFHDPFVSLAEGSIVLKGDSSIKISNCSFNGIPSGDFTLRTSDGKVAEVSGSPNTAFLQVASSIQLQAVRNAQNQKVANVPKTIGGRDIASQSPQELADLATLFLDSKIKEIKLLWGI